MSESAKPDPASQAALEALIEALRLTPENVALRQHVADMLLASNRAADAEAEFRKALSVQPENLLLKLGLAKAFHQQGKTNHALVVLEDIAKHPKPPASALVLHARLLAGMGEIEQAVAQYRRAVEFDPAVAVPEFASKLGLNAVGDSEVVEGRVRSAGEDDPGSPTGEIEKSEIRFEDVGGMEVLKEEIRLKIIYPLKRPELYRMYGKQVGGGILLYGPPGCGKTYLARATAGEIEAGFLAVGINDVLEMWIGSSERNLHSLFEQARDHAPCVLFFDEVDALGASRGDMRQHAGRQLINQFLAELDGVKSSNEGMLILAATNAPWHLDPAFRRPGRFDRILFVPPPDAEARAAILELHCREKPAQDIDYAQLARKTEHFSGADLKAIVDVAIETKLRQALKEGSPKPLTTKDLLTAAGQLRPSTKEWFATARNYALYSNQGGIYDDILKFLKL
jgi:AAA+ superfamily predicted ATPase